MTFRLDPSHIHQGRIGIDIAPDLFTATNLRDQAIAKLDAANGEEFGRRSRDFILAYLRCHGPTSGETLVIECKAAGIIPVRDDRAFGGAFLSLSRKKLIVKVGDCKRARGHSGNGGVVWAIRNS